MPVQDAQTIQTASNCIACIPEPEQAAVQTMLLATLAGGSVDPGTLANAARCFAALDGMQPAVMIYALAKLAGTSTDPNALAGLASCMRCLDGNYAAAISYLMCQWSGGGIATPPVAPTMQLMSFTDPTHQVVHWTNPAPLPTVNEVWRSTNGSAYALLATVSGAHANNLYTDSTFSTVPTDTVCYKVRSCNGTNCSAFSAIACEQNGVQTVP